MTSEVRQYIKRQIDLHARAMQPVLSELEKMWQPRRRHRKVVAR